MDRYKNTKTIKNKNYYKITNYPSINKSDNDIYIEIKQGDRLDMLAYKYYQDVTLWWVIAKANNLKGDSMFIQPPKRIRIPVNLSNIK